jgi:hypothetical protein
MQLVLRHWFNFGAIIAGAALIFLLYGWSGMGALQRMLLASFIVQLIQQYEEYGWTGRELARKEMVLQLSADLPLDPKPTVIFNLFAAYGFYLVPVFFPDVIWVGLAPMLFGFTRLAIRVAISGKLWPVSPRGQTALLFGHIPIGILYLYYIHAHHLVSAWDWTFAILYMLAWQYVALVRLICSWLADRNSPYPFSDDWNA